MVRGDGRGEWFWNLVLVLELAGGGDPLCPAFRRGSRARSAQRCQSIFVTASRQALLTVEAVS